MSVEQFENPSNDAIRSGFEQGLSVCEVFQEQVGQNVALIAPQLLPYKPGYSKPGALYDIADAKSFALQEKGLPTWIAFDGSFERVLENLVKNPPTNTVLPPRWQEVEETNRTAGEVVAAYQSVILDLATEVGMKRKGKKEDYSRINPELAVFAVEGGANKTSIVRRQVAENAMHALYGDDLSGQVLYQFGSDREVTLEIADRARGGTKPNPEHKTIRTLAPDLPIDKPFTEFQANLATALVDGFVVSNDEVDLNDFVARKIVLTHPDKSRPQLVLIEPAIKKEKGVSSGFSALNSLVGLEGKQLVVASNGQYRAKNELVAFEWAARHDLKDMQLPVAIGDETGDETRYNGEIHVTPNRPAAAYVGELAIYTREALKAFDGWFGKEDEFLKFVTGNGTKVRINRRGMELVLSA